MDRRTLLRSGVGLLGGAWAGPALAWDVPLADRLMARLDIRCQDDVPTRGLIAMGIVEQVQALPEAERTGAPMQAVLQRATLWIGQSIRALRTRLVAVRDGAQLDEGAVEAALSVAGGGSLGQQRAQARVGQELRPGRQVRFARRLIARIDHAEQRAERRCAQGEPLEVRWLLEVPEAASLPQKKKGVLKELVTFLLIIILAVLLVVGLILLIGGIVLIIGAATGNPVLVGLGFVIVVAGIVLVLLLVSGDRQGAPGGGGAIRAG